MGQKVNPKSFRLGISDEYDSVWFDLDNYSNKIYEDFQIRLYIKRELQRAGVIKIQILRKTEQIEVKVTVSRSGVVFGKKGLDLSVIKEDLKRKINSKIILTVLQLENPDCSSKHISAWVCSQIEKRVPFRRAMKMAIQKSLKAGANGVKISCSGRLGGVEIARTEWYKEGKIPLHTLRAIIDYSFNEALTTYGKTGVKVWIYKGEANK